MNRFNKYEMGPKSLFSLFRLLRSERGAIGFRRANEYPSRV